MDAVTPSLVFSQATDKLLPALFAFQGACPKVPKRNPATIQGREGKQGYSYRYADIADVLEHVRPHLQRLELLVLQPPAGSEIVTRIFHVPSGQWIEGRIPYPANERNGHALGSAITYARRFALLAVLGLAADDDDDDGAAQARAAEEGQRAQRQQRSPQALRQQAARQAAPSDGPTEDTVQTVLGQIRKASSLQAACAALKMARDTLGSHPAVNDAEAAFSDGVCFTLEKRESIEEVDAILRVVSQIKPKLGSVILAAGQQAKARIGAG